MYNGNVMEFLTRLNLFLKERYNISFRIMPSGHPERTIICFTDYIAGIYVTDSLDMEEVVYRYVNEYLKHLLS